MKFTKEYSSTSDGKVEVLYIYYKIHYSACVGSLIYILSTIIYLCFSVYKVEFFHQILVNYTLRVSYTFSDILGTIIIWE